MKFLLDVNTGGSLVSWLQEMGHDVMQVRTIDPRMKDEEILDWANREKRIIVTTDKDFEEMIWRENKRHCGLLRIEALPRSERCALFMYVLNRHQQDLESGGIVIALKKKIRIRRLLHE
jgi:predicted nuclease of predicted toxin-antitoxin system